MLKWNKDKKSSSSMKIDQPKSDHINQTFHIDRITEEEKIRQLWMIIIKQKWVLLLWKWYGQWRFRGWYRWERKPTRSLFKIEAEGDQRKAKKLLWWRNIAEEVIRKDIPGLMPRTIYNHYKLFN